MDKELGKVDSVDLCIEDHGILTLQIGLDFGGMHQGFGGVSLDDYDKVEKKRVGHACGTDFILRILNLFGVSRLEEIVGKPVFAIREPNSSLIKGLRTPDFDGGEEFILQDWQKKWFPDDT